MHISVGRTCPSFFNFFFFQNTLHQDRVHIQSFRFAKHTSPRSYLFSNFFSFQNAYPSAKPLFSWFQSTSLFVRSSLPQTSNHYPSLVKISGLLHFSFWHLHTSHRRQSFQQNNTQHGSDGQQTWQAWPTSKAKPGCQGDQKSEI